MQTRNYLTMQINLQTIKNPWMPLVDSPIKVQLKREFESGTFRVGSFGLCTKQHSVWVDLFVYFKYFTLPFSIDLDEHLILQQIVCLTLLRECLKHKQI